MPKEAEKAKGIIAAAYLQACEDHLAVCRARGANEITPYFEVAIALENAYTETIAALRRDAGMPPTHGAGEPTNGR